MGIFFNFKKSKGAVESVCCAPWREQYCATHRAIALPFKRFREKCCPARARHSEASTCDHSCNEECFHREWSECTTQRSNFSPAVWGFQKRKTKVSWRRCCCCLLLLCTLSEERSAVDAGFQPLHVIVTDFYRCKGRVQGAHPCRAVRKVGSFAFPFRLRKTEKFGERKKIVLLLDCKNDILAR